MSQGQAEYDFLKFNDSDTAITEFEPSLTRQEFAADCDINTIMANYERTGQLPVKVDPGMYVDFTQMPRSLMEFHEFMDEAQASFMSLPAQVRKEFDNDPVRFVDFASAPENLGKMREWGLAPMPADPEGAGEPAAPANPAPPPAAKPAAQ